MEEFGHGPTEAVGVLRLAAYWLFVSVPLALLAGRIFHAMNDDLIAEIEEYLRRRRRRSVRRAVGVVVGFAGIGVAIVMTTPGGSRLPNVRAVTDWAFEADAGDSGRRSEAVEVAGGARSAPAGQPVAPPPSVDLPQAGTTDPAAPDAQAEAEDGGSVELDVVAPPGSEPGAVDEADPSVPAGPTSAPKEDRPRESSTTTSTTTPPAEDEPAPTTTTTTATPPATSTTTTSTTVPPEEEPPPDTTTTAPDQTEPAEAPN